MYVYIKECEVKQDIMRYTIVLLVAILSLVLAEDKCFNECKKVCRKRKIHGKVTHPIRRRHRKGQKPGDEDFECPVPEPIIVYRECDPSTT